jgi:hypothetical protein
MIFFRNYYAYFCRRKPKQITVRHTDASKPFMKSLRELYGGRHLIRVAGLKWGGSMNEILGVVSFFVLIGLLLPRIFREQRQGAASGARWQNAKQPDFSTTLSQDSYFRSRS